MTFSQEKWGNSHSNYFLGSVAQMRLPVEKGQTRGRQIWGAGFIAMWYEKEGFLDIWGVGGKEWSITSDSWSDLLWSLNLNLSYDFSSLRKPHQGLNRKGLRFMEDPPCSLFELTFNYDYISQISGVRIKEGT